MKKTKCRYSVGLIEHTAYVDAWKDAETFVLRAPPGSLVLVVGMSGSGKNTLWRQIKPLLQPLEGKRVSGEKRVVDLLTMNNDNAFYSSKDSASRLVDELEDPFLSSNRDELLKRFGVKSKTSSHRAVPETSLRKSAGRLLKAKRVDYLALDEADMMCVIKKDGRDPADHLESWRLLALQTDTVIVLLATPRILGIWDRTSQFSRKMPTVHMRRYRAEVKKDVEDFMGLIGQLCEAFHVDKAETDRILQRGREILASVGGIFGQLLALFQRADNKAEARSRATLTCGDIERALLRKKQLRKLWKEITEGEEQLEECTFDNVIEVAQVAAAQAARIRETPPGGTPSTTPAVGERGETKATPPTKRGRGRPRGSKNRLPVRA